MAKICLLFSVILHLASAHHDIEDPWRVHFHEHGIYRAFFGGFFSTLFVIFGVLAFYYYCVRGGALSKTFPLFPRKPIIPITIPFARASNYIDPESRPETIVLTTAASSPSVFFSNSKGHTSGPWTDPNTVTVKTAYTGYNAL